VDAFKNPFWNLDQVIVWAQTRDQELVRLAAFPERHTLEIAAKAWRLKERAKEKSRDIEAELWAASGWEPPSQSDLESRKMENSVRILGLPPYAFDSSVGAVQFAWPADPATLALIEAWREADREEQEALQSLFGDRSRSEEYVLVDPSFERIPEKMKRLVRDFVARPEVQGPPQRVVFHSFETEKYTLFLLRSGRLTSTGNLLGETSSREISSADWAGLEILVSQDKARLGVWKIGKVSHGVEGDIENLRVRRDKILEAFPVDAPKQTLDQVLRDAAKRRDGTLTQANAEAIARTSFVFKDREAVRRALVRLGIQGKQGRKKNAKTPRNSA